MPLIDRLRSRSQGASAVSAVKAAPAKAGVETAPETAYQDLKSRVHNKLFDHLDLSKMNDMSEERVAEDIALATKLVIDEEKVLLTLEDRELLVRDIQHEVFGLGPLEPLLVDPTINDVLVNGYRQIYVERWGKLEKTVARFKDDAHLERIIDKIVSGVGRRIDESSPLVDARLKDGSRVNVIVPPLALDGPVLSIRRFAADPLLADDLVEKGTLTAEIVELLKGAVKARLNILVSGGTGSGKTTMLNALSAFIPEDERIVTIEDAAELQLKQEHVVRLETRPPNIEGDGQIAQRDLVINSLRMRPDRIIVGEVRGAEALDMLQAMNTGHDGSATTIHANSPRDALTRIETMVAMTGLDLPQRAVREQIAAAIHVVIQLARLSDGTRRLVSLQEITGMEGEVVTMQEIFTFERFGIDEDARVIGRLLPTGLRPSFAEMLRTAGIELPADLFEFNESAAVR